MKYVLFVLWVLCVPSQALEKWLYHPTNLLVDKNIDRLETLWRRASATGYTHVLLADSKFGRLGEMEPRYFKNVDRVKKIAAELKLEIVPAVFPVGYSNDILGQDTNLIEALPVKDLPLIVQGGVARVDDPDAPTLPGGDFSDLKKWSWKDDNIVAENGAARLRWRRQERAHRAKTEAPAMASVSRLGANQDARFPRTTGDQGAA